MFPVDYSKSASFGRSFRNPLISRYTLTGVEEALAKLKVKEKPTGIQVHFVMNASGIVNLAKVSNMVTDYKDIIVVSCLVWSQLFN